MSVPLFWKILLWEQNESVAELRGGERKRCEIARSVGEIFPIEEGEKCLEQLKALPPPTIFEGEEQIPMRKLQKRN